MSPTFSIGTETSLCPLLYVIFYIGCMCAIIVAHATYTAEAILVWENVIWVDLSVNHFFKVCNPRNGKFLHSNLEAIVCGYVCVQCICTHNLLCAKFA